MKKFLIEKMDELSKIQNVKLILLLDSIDQLNESDYDLDWMITTLPENVKIVYTVLENFQNLFGKTKTLIKNVNNFVRIDLLNKHSGREIIDTWLKQNNRQITDKQSVLLDDLLIEVDYCRQVNPLFVKLIYDIFISKWKSYENLYENMEFKHKFLSLLNINNVVEYLFSTLERVHGKILFSRLLFYMNSLQNGISEVEIEGVLSIDDNVLYNIFEYHHPPFRRFPQALWVRIKDDLKEYLIEKQIDNTPVIYWYHRCLIETSNKLYVESLEDSDRDAHLVNVLDYYNETWKIKPKWFGYNEKLKKKLKKTGSEETRITANQPIEFASLDQTKRFNKRKLRELPVIITQFSSKVKREELTLVFVFLNYEFLRGLFYTFTQAEILNLIVSSSGCLNSLDSKIISVSLFSILHQLVLYPDSIATQLIQKILIFYKQAKYLTNFINDCDQKSFKQCALVSTSHTESGLVAISKPIQVNMFVEKSKKEIHLVECMKMLNGLKFYFLLTKDLVYVLQGNSIIGEIELPPLEHNTHFYKLLLIFISNKKDGTQKMKNEKLHQGFVVVASINVLVVVSFQNELIFSKNFIDFEIDNIIQVGSEYILVSFKQQNFYEIYYIHDSSSFYMKQTFKSSIITLFSRYFTCRFLWENILSDQNQLFIFVILKNSEIQSLKINLEEKSSCLLQVVVPSSNDLTCLSCKTILYENNTRNVSILTYSDGSFGELYISLKSSKEYFLLEHCLIEFKLASTRDIIRKSKAIDFDGKSHYLFLTDEKKLYLIITNELYELDGIYDAAKLINAKNGSNYIMAFYNGILEVFQYSNKHIENSTLKIIRLNELMLHFDAITYFEFAEG